ncbi:ArsA family ATPase [Streptomyces sp. NPDC091292]|uniref:ArsA family ATPase n=1 Tax=Streptomyces sp. NPDC091292 TaxID=3365991 RepID=UPI00382D6C6D
MRTIFVTGQSGTGKTTAAAATALGTARQGNRTLILGSDPTDTLGTALGTPTGATPVTVEPGLTAVRPDPSAALRHGLVSLQDRLAPALGLLGAARLDDEELTLLPGGAEFALLGALSTAAYGPYDVVVVDLPPLPAALPLLALPEQLRRYLRRLLPPERQAARALRPLLGRLAGVPMPSAGLYETAEGWDVALAAVQAVVEDPETTVRLVAEPGPAASDLLRTTAAGLALHGLRVDALLANRVLPDDTADTWLAGLVAQQRKTLKEWASAGDGVGGADGAGGAGGTGGAHSVYEIPHLGREPRGTDDLAALRVPLISAPRHRVTWPLTDHSSEEGGGHGGLYVWHIPLPGAVRDTLDLVRRGDELVVTTGQFRRVVELPSALRRCTVAGAGLREGELRIRFVPDPELWPRA